MAAKVLSLLMLFIFTQNTAVYAQSAAQYDRIDVEGNERIASDTIRSIAGISPGSRVTNGQVNRAIQNLHDSGLFEKVSIRPQKKRLTIKVIEHPTINLIRIEGNKRLKDDALVDLVQSQSRRAFSPTLAEADAQAIADAYAVSGYLAATVTPKIIRRSDNRVDLVFEVTEGRITEVGRISIVGNRRYSDRRLKQALATKQIGLFRRFVRGDTFIEDRIEVDRQRLRDFYSKRGYIDFEVLSTTAEFAKQRNSFHVTLHIHEGQQYKFNEITIVSQESDIDAADYLDLNTIKAGNIYTPQKVDTLLERIDHRASSLGKNFVQSTQVLTRDDENRTVDIEVSIVRGPKLFVERIDIEGNSTTLDRVIRDRFRTVEGDSFNQREIRNATNAIRATGFFENVNVETREGSSPEQIILDVDVEEQPTGTLGFGVTASTDSGFGLNLDVSERNFLGRGQTFAASASLTGQDSEARFQFIEPRFLGRDLRFGIELGRITTDLNDTPYDTETLNFAPSLSFPASENGRLRFFAEFSNDRINTNSDTGSGGDSIGEASLAMISDFGTSSTGLIGLTYSVDKRNSVIEPTSGYNFSVTQELAGLTGDRIYARTQADAKVFKSFFNEEIIVSGEIQGGFIASANNSTLITERFFLGGASLRGFEQQGLGPRDTVVNQALGGNQFFAIRGEASFPLGLPEEYGIHGGVFFDAGSVWGLDNTTGSGGQISDNLELRSSIGLSLFWETPLGPLRFDFARALQRQDFDETESFRFSVETRF